ncbi:hypothetical protein A2291_03040 [candidate division WOR-1 bacterium RIFOXYB2_FULL_42_35]|uniref:Glycosyl transferase family 1 domain-containing protein n=1 Tax=candidate division WOR-1 bacterium RIFOXYC2_FULL_41_25 TaxID=1802586 RepID=A0A1F4TST0_UNCSA|nr:MAG: hypothetical protein A2247_01350 [candidate division WOR-1 bacterium RIFOXYA2_FULL_41_14]OGC25721.1 MAG: hypothetical protein A2291_03040 [candidate division WOR-1 bacterium RIFOXYB2_FULL_42_35]OGC35123.1 MAG: hypothetical protein A2462_06185 [candidate division WOR-1 bacterium RIFOXYC2_FULL_41_25]
MKNRVVLIGSFPPPYHGTSIALEQLANSKVLNRAFCVKNINTSGARLITDLNIGKFRPIKFLKDILSFFALGWQMIVFRPKIVYLAIAQTRLGFLRDSLFILLAKICRKKCVIHLHGGYFRVLYENSGWPLKLWIKMTLSQLDLAIVLTSSLRDVFRGLVAEEKIVVVTNFVVNELLPTESEVEAKLTSIKFGGRSNFKVLFLNNLLVSKGFFDILRAAAILKQQSFPLEFIFAGSWPSLLEKNAAENYVKANNLTTNVQFVGFVKGTEKKQLLWDSDLFVFPTYYPYEGLPIAILEAMAAGLPIITTMQGGIPDVVLDRVNGFFVPAQAPEKLVQAIKELFSDHLLCANMAEENINKIKQGFTAQKYEQAFVDLFTKLVFQ